jgi:hypothetical protein
MEVEKFYVHSGSGVREVSFKANVYIRIIDIM